MHLTHVRLLVTRFDECFRFYRDVMAFGVMWGAEGEGYADFQVSEGVALALFDRHAQAEAVGAGNLPTTAQAQDRFTLIFASDGLDAEIERLRQRGASILVEPQDRPEWGIKVAYLRDPDGNLIELNSPLPRDQWVDELRSEAETYSG